jgi:catechol 2,3-dioxygenase-like lactoylglutathione lyase family enzyme
MKKRVGDPWIPASEYGRALQGFGINLLVKEIAVSVEFAKSVLQAEVLYADPDFAVLRRQDMEWMLHADHTYEKHPLINCLNSDGSRGSGIELRIHGLDPDEAERCARMRGDRILAGAIDKKHGLREVYILDPDGYLWVPDVPTRD